MPDKVEQTDPLRVALYLRVSTEDQIEKYGLPMQKEALEALLVSKGTLENGKPVMKLAGKDHIYKDEGISGTTPALERPEFTRMMENALLADKEDRPFDAIAVYKIDRLARKLKVLLEIKDLFEENDLQFLSSTENIDTSNAFGRAMFNFIGIIAELELETFKERSKGGRDEAIKDGKIMGSAAPFGYTKDKHKRHKILKKESEIIEEIFDMYVNQGLTPQQIASDLTNKGIPTPEASAVLHGKREGKSKKKNPINFWRSEPIRNILRNELYIGDYYTGKYKNNKYLPKSEWKLSPYKPPPIIDRMIFEKAQQLLENKYISAKNTADNHTYLLSGLLTCDCCFRDKARMRWTGERKRIKRDSDKYTYLYKCGRKNRCKSPEPCNSLPLPAKEIEEYVVGFTRKLLENPMATYEYQQRLKSNKNELNQLKNKRKNITKIHNGLIQQRQNILEQNKLGFLSKSAMTKQITTLDTQITNSLTHLNEVSSLLSQHSMSENYTKSLNLFAKKYRDMLKNTMVNRKEISRILHMLIDEIIVYTRPVKLTGLKAGACHRGSSPCHCFLM